MYGNDYVLSLRQIGRFGNLQWSSTFYCIVVAECIHVDTGHKLCSDCYIDFSGEEHFKLITNHFTYFNQEIEHKSCDYCGAPLYRMIPVFTEPCKDCESAVKQRLRDLRKYRPEGTHLPYVIDHSYSERDSYI